MSARTPVPLPGPSPPVGGVDHLLAEVRRLHDKVDAGLADLRDRLTRRTKSHLTVEEVAAATGRSAYTVRRRVKARRLTATRVAGDGPKGRLLVAREELEALVRAGSGANVPDALIA